MKIIGHRGAAGLAPENTLAGLQKALDHHADMLEFDLRVTKDKIVVLHHDEDLNDPSGNKLRISEHSYQELLAHKPDLTTFKEVLNTIDRFVPLIVEIKPDEPVEPIMKLIKENPRPDISLASFSQKVLLELQAALPDIPKIVIERWSGVRAGRRMRQLGTKKVFMNQRWLWWGFIRSVSRSGWQLYAYTLNNPKKARRWAKRGLAGVITDYPDRFEK